MNKLLFTQLKKANLFILRRKISSQKTSLSVIKRTVIMLFIPKIFLKGTVLCLIFNRNLIASPFGQPPANPFKNKPH